MNINEYQEYLLNILDNNNDISFDNNLMINLYMILLSLNNHNYNNNIYLNELDVLEEFLRKVNNLKIKIQLKRKAEEIDNLNQEIKALYKDKKIIIDTYNTKKIKINKILDEKEPSKLTELIDSLTKEKIALINYKDYYDNLRNTLTYLLFNDTYYIDNNQLHFMVENNFSVKLDEFYHIFNYLLITDNYSNTYNNKNDLLHNDLIKEIINNIGHKKISKKMIILLILTFLVSKDIPDYENVDMTKFTIVNIRITDLYSFAKTEIKENNAHWKNIFIPNEYLYKKIRELINKGMYYFDNDKFILENIENNISDFKISIDINDLKIFLKNNLLNIINQS